MKKLTVRLSIILVIILAVFSTNSSAQESIYSPTVDNTYSYAYISVRGRLFSKMLRVSVDFGDTPEQLKKGEEFSDILSNKKSYAAILNYMIDNGFELSETLSYESLYQGSGGTSGIVFIMRKKK